VQARYRERRALIHRLDVLFCLGSSADGPPLEGRNPDGHRWSNVIEFVGLPMAETCKRVAELPDDSIVIYFG
jgi:hypothetical protein